MNATQRVAAARALMGTPAISTNQSIDKKIVETLGRTWDHIEERAVGDDSYWATFNAARLERKLKRLQAQQ